MCCTVTKKYKKTKSSIGEFSYSFNNTSSCLSIQYISKIYELKPFNIALHGKMILKTHLLIKNVSLSL